MSGMALWTLEQVMWKRHDYHPNPPYNLMSHVPIYYNLPNFLIE